MEKGKVLVLIMATTMVVIMDSGQCEDQNQTSAWTVGPMDGQKVS